MNYYVYTWNLVLQVLIAPHTDILPLNNQDVVYELLRLRLELGVVGANSPTHRYPSPKQTKLCLSTTTTRHVDDCRSP